MSLQLFAPSLISSFVEVILTQPIDVIKTYKQANKIHTLQPSLTTLYSGFVPRALGNIPSRSIFLFTQDYFKTVLDKKHHWYTVPVASGFSQTLVDTPVEILKMNQIFKINNKNYYSGFIAHCTRNIIFLGFVFNFKEYGKRYDSIFIASGFGAVGGLIGCYVSHPLDTLKTKIQTMSNYNITTFKQYMAGSHLRAGMGFINMSISLTVFELLKILDLF